MSSTNDPTQDFLVNGGWVNAVASHYPTPPRDRFGNIVDPNLDYLKAGANAAPRANPYDMAAANQSRGAQLGLLAQMQARQNGPSLAGLMAQQAQGQGLGSALGGMAAGTGGALGQNAAMNAAAQAGGQLAGSSGQARMQEYMNALQQQTAMVAGMRQRSQLAAQQNAESGIQMQGLDDANTRFYANLGQNYSDFLDRQEIERRKLIGRLAQASQKGNLDAIKTGAQAVATVVGA